MSRSERWDETDNAVTHRVLSLIINKMFAGGLRWLVSSRRENADARHR
jgi:hypothetical protein